LGVKFKGMSETGVMIMLGVCIRSFCFFFQSFHTKKRNIL